MSASLDAPPVAAPELLEVAPRPVRRLWAAPAITAVGVALAVLGMVRSRESDIGGLGLVDALHPFYFAGVALVLAGAVLELTSPLGRRRWFAAQLVALAFLLHGVTGVVEANPRFPTAYLHVGFADEIARNGTLLQGLDARFNWAGFFAGNALVQQATGGAPVDWAIRFFPLVVNLLLLVLVDVLGRAAHVSLHRRRAAQLLFLTSNWIGQDYFSPQATASVMYLVSILLAVLFFADTGLSDRRRRLVGATRRRSPGPVSAATRAGAMAALLLITAALVSGHQITPGFLAMALVWLAVARVTTLRAYPFVIVAATLGWLCYAAQAYWSGHLEKLTGSAGRVSTLVQQNVTERAASGSFDRSIVVHGRLAFTGLLVLAVLLSLVVLRLRRRVPILLACLVLAPWPMLLLQAYGGEMALRVLLISLPAVSLLAAAALLPDRRRLRAWHRVAVWVVLAGLVPLFLVARYGNESYERISSNDLAVLQPLYAHQPDGKVLVLTANSKGPRFFRQVGAVRFMSLHTETPAEIAGETAHRPGYDRRYVFLGETQDALDVQLASKPPGWTGTLAGELVASGHFRMVAHRGGSYLLRLVPAHGNG